MKSLKDFLEQLEETEYVLLTRKVDYKHLADVIDRVFHPVDRVVYHTSRE